MSEEMVDRKSRSTLGVWFVFVIMPFMYGAECLMVYGSCQGYRSTWNAVWPIFLFAGTFALLGIILEIDRYRSKESDGE